MMDNAGDRWANIFGDDVDDTIEYRTLDELYEYAIEKNPFGLVIGDCGNKYRTYLLSIQFWVHVDLK